MDTEKKYKDGFNNGYLLAKHEPDLLADIVKTLEPSNDYLQGLFSGKEEFERENTRTQLDELHRLRDQAQDRESELDREK